MTLEQEAFVSVLLAGAHNSAGFLESMQIKCFAQGHNNCYVLLVFLPAGNVLLSDDGSLLGFYL